MKHPSPSTSVSLRKLNKLRRISRQTSPESETTIPPDKFESLPEGHEVRVICLYPTIEAGKLARHWLESAFHHVMPDSSRCIEYYNYAVLAHDGISWRHAIDRIQPDIILMIGDGRSQLLSGFRHSLKALLSESCHAKKPLVIFRDLEVTPSINTSVLIDYVAALTDHNHCEFNALDGNGAPISCFRHPRLLLKTRRHHE